MPFSGSTIAQTEAELWGLQDSAENAHNDLYNLATYGAQLGGPQDGVFGELQSIDDELNASGGPRGWLPGLLVALLGIVFGSVAWLNQGLDNWVQWGKNNAVDGFNDFLEGMRALIEVGPKVMLNAVQGAVAYAQSLYNVAVNYSQQLYNLAVQHAQADNANTVNYAQSLYNQSVTYSQQLYNQAVGAAQALDVQITGDVGAIQQQEQADVGNLRNLIDQNFFTLQQQERTDTANLGTQIQTQIKPQVDALNSLIALTVVPAIGAATAIATATADKLKQDEDNCIDPMCKNLSKNSNATGILNDLGILAMVLAFIAECVHDPKGVSDFIGGTIAPVAKDTVAVTTAL